jgi:hypothetical protein
MFLNCPYCRALVATDPVTDLPPSHCPQCGERLRNVDGTLVTALRPAGEAPAPEAAPAPTPAPAEDFAAMERAREDEAFVREARAQGDPLDAFDQDSTTDEEDAETVRRRVEFEAAAIAAALLAPVPRAERGLDEQQLDALVDANLAAESPALLDADRIDAALQAAPEALPLPGEPDDAADVAAPAAAAAPAPSRARPRVGLRVPSFARGKGDGTRRFGHWPLVSVIALALLLVLQVLLADRARFAASPTWRPVVAALCGVFRCALPPWREPEAFTLVQRDVRQHPTLPGVLRVSATFRNDARWAQPWPQVHLTLSDLNGRRAGERAFLPQEYLGGEPEQAELAPGESVAIAMDIVEPAPQIVAFDFRFR